MKWGKEFTCPKFPKGNYHSARMKTWLTHVPGKCCNHWTSDHLIAFKYFFTFFFFFLLCFSTTFNYLIDFKELPLPFGKPWKAFIFRNNSADMQFTSYSFLPLLLCKCFWKRISALLKNCPTKAAYLCLKPFSSHSCKRRSKCRTCRLQIKFIFSLCILWKCLERLRICSSILSEVQILLSLSFYKNGLYKKRFGCIWITLSCWSLVWQKGSDELL